MKNKIKILVLVTLLSAGILTSCMKEDSVGSNGPQYGQTLLDFGEVTRVDTDGYFEIMRDDGDMLLASSYSGSYRATEEERVCYTYTVIGEVPGYFTSKSPGPAPIVRKAYEVEVISFINILSKDILRQSELNDIDNEIIVGNDLIRAYDITLTGNYINIGFEYMRYESEVEHLISLVWDDTRVDEDGVVHLYLRHNAFGEVPGMGEPLHSDTGLCSFKLSQLVPEGADGMKIKLIWNWDGTEEGEFSASGEFFPLGGSGNGRRILGNKFSPASNDTTFVR